MEESQKKNYFEELNSINVGDKIEQIDNGKRKLNYLSWAWAWGELKKLHPDATSIVYENENGLNYHTDGRTAWVKVGVTVNGIEHIEYLPVMNRAHKSLPLNEITSWDVNVAIQRATTKAIGRHGLGLYIYAGEDLPEEEQKEKLQDEKMKEAEIKAKLAGYFNRHEYNEEDLAQIAKIYKVKSVKDMSAAQCNDYIARLEKQGRSIDE